MFSRVLLKSRIMELCFMRRLLILLALGVSLFIAGCATIVEGQAQIIRVETDPAGALCVITRNGRVVSRIPSTPGTISLFKEKGNLNLRCTKTGFLPAEFEQEAEFSSTVFGNILFGGLIGAAIDVGGGATHKYPGLLLVTMIPESFSTQKELVDFFSAVTDRLKRRYQKLMDEVREECDQDDCSGKIVRLEASLEEALERLETQRKTVKVIHP